MAKQKKRRRVRSSGTRQRRVLFQGWWHAASAETKGRALRFCLHLLLIAALAAGAVFGLRRLDRYVHDLPRYGGPIQVAVEGEPEWLAAYPEVRQRILIRGRDAILQKAALPGTAQPIWLDEGLARCVADAAGEDPFVERVIQADKQLIRTEDKAATFVRRVTLTIQFRRPLARLRAGDAAGRSFLLDAKGVVLDCRGPRDAPVQLPWIVRHGPTNQLGVGARLDGADDIAAGLELARLLVSQPYFTQIDEIDVANVGRRHVRDGAELVLVIHPPRDALISRDQWIEWGLRPSSRMHGDNPTAVKLAHLLWLYHWKDRETLWRADDPEAGAVADIFRMPDRIWFTSAPGGASGAVGDYRQRG